MKYTKNVNGFSVLNTKNPLLNKIMLFKHKLDNANDGYNTISTAMILKMSIIYEKIALKEIKKKYRMKFDELPDENHAEFCTCDSICEQLLPFNEDDVSENFMVLQQESCLYNKFTGTEHIHILYEYDAYSTGYDLGYSLCAKEHLNNGESEEDFDIDQDDVICSFMNFTPNGESELFNERHDAIPKNIKKYIESWVIDAHNLQYEIGGEGRGSVIFIESKTKSKKLASVLSNLIFPYSNSNVNITPVDGGFILWGDIDSFCDGYSYGNEFDYIHSMASMFKVMCIVYELWGKEMGWWKRFKVNKSY